jgi:hypothetical protein
VAPDNVGRWLPAAIRAGCAVAFHADGRSVTPYAVWADGARSRSLLRRAEERRCDRAQSFYFDGLIGGSGAQITKPMFDDGTHGDAVAATASGRSRCVSMWPSPVALYDGC